MFDLKIRERTCSHCENPTDYMGFSMYRGYVPVCEDTDCIQRYDEAWADSLNKPMPVIVSPELFKKLKEFENELRSPLQEK